MSDRGISLQLEVLDEVRESEWQFWEQEYIRLFRIVGFKLVNGTDGGDGGSRTVETRRKMSRAHTGKPLSAEHRAAARAGKIGKKRKPFSDEWRRNIGLAHKGLVPWNKGKVCPEISAGILRKKTR